MPSACGNQIAEKMEAPVRKILMWAPVDKAAKPNAMASPHAFDDFVGYAPSQYNYELV